MRFSGIIEAVFCGMWEKKYMKFELGNPWVNMEKKRKIAEARGHSKSSDFDNV